jgi:hypothetical protein
MQLRLKEIELERRLDPRLEGLHQVEAHLGVRERLESIVSNRHRSLFVEGSLETH